MTSGRSAGSIPLIGGHLALNFANTAGWHASDERSEWLTAYGEVLAWARRAADLPPKAARALEKEAARRPGRTIEALARVIEHRETVYRIFTAIAQGGRPERADLLTLHAMRLMALGAGEPTWDRTDGSAVRWPDDGRDLLRPLYPVAVAAADLLATGAFGRLRQCGNHPCGWLFLDASRSGTRRWCSSGECGNAARVKRFRARRAKGARGS